MGLLISINICPAQTQGSMVVGWGDNIYGQTNAPSTLTNPVAITAGSGFSVAAKADGTVTNWGDDALQVTPPPNLNNVVAVAAGGGSSSPFVLALESTGSVIGWGANNGKQTNIPPDLSNAVAIAAGQNHGMALRCDGKVFVWGFNASGQTNVPISLTNATAIASGLNFCLALQNNGSVMAWGDNSYHQTNIPPGLTNVTAIACGWYHCLALKNDSTVTAWGFDSYQQTNVPAGLTNVIAVAAGEYHSLALKNDGTVVAWGYDTYKQTNVPPGLNHVVAIAGGDMHSLALVENGTPMIYVQPVSQTNYAGLSTFLSGNASGLQPLYFQWMLNGTNIAGATNTSLTLNLQPNVAGTYSFICSNDLGVAISSNAVVVVLTNSPAFALQPTNQTSMEGSNVTFSAAIGAGPVPNTYQWQFNGTNIIGATNLSLTLTGVQLTNQGNYSIVASNAYGATASSNAYLFVLDLPTALNEPTWTWINTSSSNWFPETTDTADGYEAAQSGTAPYEQYSTLQTTVTGPGAMTFWWKFWPQGGVGGPFFNSLSLSSSVAGVSLNLPATNTWQQSTVYLGAGPQTVSWIYSHFYSFAQSTGWVDQVSFTPGSTAPAATYVTPNIYLRTGGYATMYVTAYGTPPLAYQWQLNGTNLPGQTHYYLIYPYAVPTNSGTYTITVTNSYGSFSTNITLWVGQFGLDTSPTNTFMSSNGFQMQLDGILTTNPVVLFGSTDLVNWLPVFTNPPTTGSVQFIDPTATNLPARFYRAQE